MKTVITTHRAGRAGERANVSSDDTLGQGMDLALTIAVFIVVGALIDNWLGIFPVMTIALVVVAAVGSFVKMKYVYTARMEELEAERLQARRPATGITAEQTTGDTA